MQERQSPRRKALKGGKILLSKWASIDCTIKDVTEAGARLEFKSPTELPAEFKLLILATDQTIPAELVWQRGLSAGVRFEQDLLRPRTKAA